MRRRKDGSYVPRRSPYLAPRDGGYRGSKQAAREARVRKKNRRRDKLEREARKRQRGKRS